MSDIKDGKIFVFSFACNSMQTESTYSCGQADRGTIVVDSAWEEGQFDYKHLLIAGRDAMKDPPRKG